MNWHLVLENIRRGGTERAPSRGLVDCTTMNLCTMNQPTSNDDLWEVYDYEVHMLRSMCALLREGNLEYEGLSREVKNAVTESVVLHTRQLVDILLSRGNREDDLTLSRLLPNFQPNGLVSLRCHYGDTNKTDSPCWTINKRLAHATTQRDDRFDYSPLLNSLVPLLEVVLNEVQVQREGSVV